MYFAPPTSKNLATDLVIVPHKYLQRQDLIKWRAHIYVEERKAVMGRCKTIIM